jgi:hypothetical protein
VTRMSKSGDPLDTCAKDLGLSTPEVMHVFMNGAPVGPARWSWTYCPFLHRDVWALHHGFVPGPAVTRYGGELLELVEWLSRLAIEANGEGAWPRSAAGAKSAYDLMLVKIACVVWYGFLSY